MSRPTLRWSSTLPFVYGAITRYGRTFQTVPLSSHRLVPTGLFPVRSPLLAESRLISFPPGTEMFQFPGFASHTYVFSMQIPPKRWVSPFGHPRIKACLPAPRGFSQATTSFIAFYRQGIHHMRLFA